MKFFSWFKATQEFDPLIEGTLAHNIKDINLRTKVSDRYRELYCPEPNPISHPELYDPLNPPNGWAWDAYYECWISVYDRN